MMRNNYLLTLAAGAIITIPATALEVTFDLAGTATAIAAQSLDISDPNNDGQLNTGENSFPITISANNESGVCISISSQKGALLHSGVVSEDQADALAHQKIPVKLQCSALSRLDQAVITHESEWAPDSTGDSGDLYSITSGSPVTSQQVVCQIFSSDLLSEKISGSFSDTYTLNVDTTAACAGSQ
jgi:hypothetical protein